MRSRNSVFTKTGAGWPTAESRPHLFIYIISAAPHIATIATNGCKIARYEKRAPTVTTFTYSHLSVSQNKRAPEIEFSILCKQFESLMRFFLVVKRFQWAVCVYDLCVCSISAKQFWPLEGLEAVLNWGMFGFNYEELMFGSDEPSLYTIWGI